MVNGVGNQTGGAQGARLTGPLSYFRVVLQQIERLHDIDAIMIDVGGRAFHKPNCFMLKNVDFSRSPPTVFQQWTEQTSGGTVKLVEFAAECYGEDGKTVTAGSLDEPAQPTPPPPPPGEQPARAGLEEHAGSVRCTVERAKFGPRWCNRTFDRKRSRAIDEGSWVYVMRALATDSQTAEMIRELQFDKTGKFRYQIPDRANESSLARNPTAESAIARSQDLELSLPTQAALDLPMEHPDTGRPAEYYFYLARWRLPWMAVETLEAKPAELAVRLGDLFHTDVYDFSAAGGPDTAEPLLARPQKPPQPAATRPSLTTKRLPAYVLHLVDPFVEAQRRADDLGRSIDALEPAQNQQKDGARYRFARELELFTAPSTHDREIISDRLYAYLYRDGGFERVQRIWQMIHSRAYDLVSWIGQKERRYLEEAHRDGIHHAWGDLFEVRVKEPYTGAPRAAAEDLHAPSDTWSSAYATALSFYTTASARILQQVVDADCAAKVRLLETSVGQAYLDRDLGAFLWRDKDLQGRLTIDPREVERWRARGHVDTSGLDLLISTKAILADESRIWDNVNAVYSGAWARKLRAFTFGVERSGQELVARSLLPSRKVSDLRRRRELAAGVLQEKGGRLLRTLSERARIPTDKIKSIDLKLSNAGAAGLGAFRAGLDFWIAFEHLRQARTVHERLVASGDIAGATKSIIEKSLEVRHLVTGQPAKFPAVSGLGVYATAVGVIGKGWDVLESHDAGEAVGRSIAFCSSLVGVYGAAFASGGVSLVIQGLCTVLDFLGGEIATEYSDASRFLRACDFGDPRYKKAGFYFPLPLEDVGNRYVKAKRETPWTLADQHQALRGLMYRLEPVLRIAAPAFRLEVELEPWYLHCFTAEVRWSGYLDVTHEAVDLYLKNERGHLMEAERTNQTHSRRVLITEDAVCIDDAGKGLAIDCGSVHQPPVPAAFDRLIVRGHLELTVPGDTSSPSVVLARDFELRRDMPRDRSGRLPSAPTGER